MDEVAVAQFADGTRFGIQLIDVGGSVPPELGPGGSQPRRSAGDDRLTTPTGLREHVREGVGSLAALLAGIATDIGTEISAVEPEHRPAEVEAEVCLGISAQAGPVWLSGKGEYTLRAKLTWRF
ncbi:MAG: hypothetical protein ACRDNZ_18205 [Streptosporangiaceae bacterium]